MPSAIVIGGGLAGLAAAAALSDAGFQVDLFEARGFLGGRATSYPLPGDGSEVIDNCQHLILRCCVNILDFYKRLDVLDRIHFHKQFYFIEPGGRTSVLAAGRLPAPFHFTGSFRKLACLSVRDKLSIARGLLALPARARQARKDLDRITMLDWLREKRQTEPAIHRFWGQVLVSAVNEELDRMAAIHGFQVFWLGFLARSNSYQMGIPAVPLGGTLCAVKRGSDRATFVCICARRWIGRWWKDGSVRAVERQGEQHSADYYVSALPFERVPAVAPEWSSIVSAFRTFAHHRNSFVV